MYATPHWPNIATLITGAPLQMKVTRCPACGPGCSPEVGARRQTCWGMNCMCQWMSLSQTHVHTVIHMQQGRQGVACLQAVHL